MLPEVGKPRLQSITFASERVGWMIADEQHLLQSQDRGSSWQTHHATFPGTNPIVTKLTFQDELSGWAAGRAGQSPVIWRTTNGGDDWEAAYEWTLSGEGEMGALLDIQTLGREKVWAAGFKNGGAFIVASADGGRHWKVQYAGEEIGGQVSAIRFADADHGFALLPTGVLETSDGGEHWRLSQFDPTALQNDLAVIGKDDVWVAGAWSKMAHRAKRGWSIVTVPPAEGKFIAWVAFLNPRAGWVSGPGGTLFATADGGKTWRADAVERVTENTDALFAFDFRVFLVVQPGLLYFRDVK